MRFRRPTARQPEPTAAAVAALLPKYRAQTRVTPARPDPGGDDRRPRFRAEIVTGHVNGAPFYELIEFCPTPELALCRKQAKAWATHRAPNAPMMARAFAIRAAMIRAADRRASRASRA
jgi:hypothetical protein